MAAKEKSMNKFGAFIEQFLICQTPADGIDILRPDSWRRFCTMLGSHI
jgi:hypothetical protein